MVNISDFINQCVVERSQSLFESDILANKDALRREIEGKSLCVIGGAGSIGSEFIKAVLPFRPRSLVVIDLNENSLAELTRDLRSAPSMPIPEDYRTYTLNFDDPIFRRIFVEDGGYDIVANFSAHKHVRSEKDKYSVQALIENNDIKAKRLMDLLVQYPPKHFFCVSTDKAANPVNIMGASKLIMEEMVMAYSQVFPVTTARFANVAFSCGSLPDGWLHRIMKRQPLAAPTDVLRYFVTPQESGQICMLACMLGRSGEVFFPKLDKSSMLSFAEICTRFLNAMGMQPRVCASDEEARQLASSRCDDQPEYPVAFFPSDTTGEKPYEEFYVEGEDVDLSRFNSLGVIPPKAARRGKTEVEAFFNRLNSIFANPEFTKAEIVEAIKTFLPNFEHEEKGRNLDQKM